MGTAKVALVLALVLGLLSLLALGLRWIYRRGQETGRRRAEDEISKGVIDAGAELAHKLNSGAAGRDAHFGVRTPGGWGEGPPPQA